MNFIKKLKTIFLSIIIVSSILLIYNFYISYTFKHNDLSLDILEKLKAKENNIKFLINQNFHLKINIPIKISKKMSNNLYGLATLDKNKNITIYLNKNMFQESEEYMLDNVLAHEYAHALMFVFGNISNKNGGHTRQWQNICKKIGGIKCERFVDYQDILIDKLHK